jgi:AraC family transcriptional regulator of arabinose operon
MTSIGSPADFRIGKVLRSIESNPSQSISDLARSLNLSNSRLSHLFKARTGQSLNVFLVQRRLDKAAGLLRATEMRVKEITYGVGYCQEPSFVPAFKKRFDCSPTIYRNQQRPLLRNGRVSYSATGHLGGLGP